MFSQFSRPSLLILFFNKILYFQRSSWCKLNDSGHFISAGQAVYVLAAGCSRTNLQLGCTAWVDSCCWTLITGPSAFIHGWYQLDFGLWHDLRASSTQQLLLFPNLRSYAKTLKFGIETSWVMRYGIFKSRRIAFSQSSHNISSSYHVYN